MEVKKLSSEAPPFVSYRVKNCFDHPLPAFKALCKPPARAALSFFWQSTDQLEDLKSSSNLLDEERSLLLDHSRACGLISTWIKLPKESVLQHLRNLQILLHVENCERAFQIRLLDVHSSKLFLDHENLVQVHCQGASEQRPAIRLGQIVRFRPVSEYAFQRSGFLGEIWGRVMDVANEKVKVSFPLHLRPEHCRLCGQQSNLNIILKCGHHIEFCDTCSRHQQLSPHCYVCGKKRKGAAGTFTRRNHQCAREWMTSFLESTRFHVRWPRNDIFFKHQFAAISQWLSDPIASAVLFPGERELNWLFDQLPVHLQNAIGKSGLVNPEDIATENPEATVVPQTIKFAHCEDMNPSQRLALEQVTGRPPCCVPFILYGPAGCGKTVTVAKSVFQLLHHEPTSRILLLAPSDGAADVLASHLNGLGVIPAHMARLNAANRKIGAVRPELLPFCKVTATGEFRLPLQSELEHFRILVSTCYFVAELRASGVGPGFFSHIVMDEASQATEPEALLGLACTNKSTRIVLAGDPRQLGATLRSKVADHAGLGVSLVERLLARPVYKTGHNSLVVMLTDNYRSHFALLELSSRLFYDGMITARGSSETTSCLTKWEALPRDVQFPLLLWCVNGRAEHPVDSPSYSNLEEVGAVCSVITLLLESRTIKTSPREIGVLAAYRRQVVEIRKALRRLNLQVRVGSVEDYQGQESSVSIVSTVMTASAVDSMRRHRHLPDAAIGGVLFQPKRFNVAVTRGKSLTVIIAQPEMMVLDPLWRLLLFFCVANGAIAGEINPIVEDARIELAEDPDMMERLFEETAAMVKRGRGSELYTSPMEKGEEEEEEEESATAFSSFLSSLSAVRESAEEKPWG